MAPQKRRKRPLRKGAPVKFGDLVIGKKQDTAVPDPMQVDRALAAAASANPSRHDVNATQRPPLVRETAACAPDMGQASPSASGRPAGLKASPPAFMAFRVIRPELAADMMLRSLLNGDAADAEDGRLIWILAAAVETMRAPYADPTPCVSCGAPFPDRKAAPGFIIGTELDGGYLWKPLCDVCLKLGDAELLERFATAFQGEYPTARRVERDEARAHQNES